MKVIVNKLLDRTIKNMRVVEFYAGPTSSGEFNHIYTEIRLAGHGNHGSLAKVTPAIKDGVTRGYAAVSHGGELLSHGSEYLYVVEDALDALAEELEEVEEVET